MRIVERQGLPAALGVALCVGLAACEPVTVDFSPPKLLRAPFAPGLEHEVPVRPQLRFAFNEPLDPNSVHAGAVVLVPWQDQDERCDAMAQCEADDDERVLCVAGQCQRDPLTSGLAGDLADGDAGAGVLLQVQLEAGPGGPDSVVVLQPVRALPQRWAYAALVGPGVRDLAGNPVGYAPQPEEDQHDDDAQELQPPEPPAPLRADFVSDARGSSGPEPELVWPVPGARVVPTNLEFVETAFWQPVPPSPDARLFLERESFGDASAAGQVGTWLSDPVACPGWVPGTCLRWRLSEALEPAARYRLGVGEFVDAQGLAAQLPADSAWFEVGPGPDLRAPVFAAQTFERGPCTHVAFTVNERVRAHFEGGAGNSASGEGEGYLELALRGGERPGTAVLRVTDGAGNQAEHDVEVAAVDPNVDLVIGEVLVNAEGSESAGEFVELARLPAHEKGARSYAGLWITDLPWAEVLAELDAGEDPPGDPLPDFELAPGQLAVIAADAFDPNSVPADAKLLSIGTSIASGGIKNDGEPLCLYDPVSRQLWSSYSVSEAHIDHGASAHQGRSAVRRSLSACDLDASWVSAPGGGATPGR